MKKKILVLGANGLLGNTLFSILIKNRNYEVLGTYRKKSKNLFYKKYNANLINNFDVYKLKNIENILKKFKPHYLINCIGITNKEVNNNKIYNLFFINSYLPQILNNLSKIYNFRFFHISTDCVFDGKSNIYYENSFKTAFDLYGISKSFGEEFSLNKNNLILRTSIIGHELDSAKGLLEWFISQKKVVKGFCNVIYSGVTTNELSRIIIILLKLKHISGLYQISSKPISKYSLISLIKKIYNIDTKIIKNYIIKKKLVLNCEKFKKGTNVKISSWISQIKNMKIYHEKHKK